MRVTEVKIKETSWGASYVTDYMVRLDDRKRWYRVRWMGSSNLKSLYVHVGEKTLFLNSSFKPEQGDEFL